MYPDEYKDEIPSKFPSPCGVLVLKLTKTEKPVEKKPGFRPLAGFWFLNTKE